MNNCLLLFNDYLTTKSDTETDVKSHNDHYNVQCTMLIAQCTINKIQYKMCKKQYKLQNEQCKTYSE